MEMIEEVKKSGPGNVLNEEVILVLTMYVKCWPDISIYGFPDNE